MLYLDILADKPAEATALIFRDAKTTYGSSGHKLPAGPIFQAKGLKQGEKSRAFQ